MRRFDSQLVFVLCVSSGLLASAGLAAQQQPAREITRITGDLYWFRNAFHFSVFLVTPAGIVVADPIDAEAARWLKQELDSEGEQF